MSSLHEFHEVTPEELAKPQDEPSQWAYVPEPLTPQQRYRLVMIAHETKEPSVRTAALTLLAQELHPLVPVP